MNEENSEQVEIKLGRQFGWFLYGILILFSVTLAIAVSWGGKDNIKQNLIEEQKNTSGLFQQELIQLTRTYKNSLKQFASVPGTPQRLLTMSKGVFFVYRPEQVNERLDDYEATPLFENQVWFLENALALSKQNDLDYVGLYLVSPHDSIPQVPPTAAVEFINNKLVLPYFEFKGKFRNLEQYSHQIGLNQTDDIQVNSRISALASDARVVREAKNTSFAHRSLGLRPDKIVPKREIDPTHEGIELISGPRGLALRISQKIIADSFNIKSGKNEPALAAILVYEKELGSGVMKKFAAQFAQDLAILENDRIATSSLSELIGNNAPTQNFITLNNREYFTHTAPLAVEGIQGNYAVTILSNTDKLSALSTTIYRYIAFSTLVVLIVISPFLSFILNGYTRKVQQRTMLLRQQNEKLDKLSGEAESARQRLVDMTDRLPLTVVQFHEALNGERHYLFVGKNVHQVLGISTEEMVHDKEARWRNVIDEDYHSSKTLVMEKLAAREPIEFSHRIRIDGKIRWIYTHTIPTRFADGSWVWNGFYMDVTAAREQAEDLRVATIQAEQATRAKSAFLANMSHEIRTPMNAIMGLSLLAMKTELSPQQRDYLNKIYNSSESLLHIINDILDFSKVEAGQLTLECIPFVVNDVLNHVAGAIAFKAQSKGLELLFDLDPEVPPVLVGDPLRLCQIIINLANNAVKFTDRGEIIVRLHCESRINNQIMLFVDVSDTGMGISPEQLATLFRPFTQADVSTTRKYGGTGLGLAICKQLTELMGGAIWASSERQVGSVFTFTAELEMPPDGAHSKIDFAGLHQQRVLVVDDNLNARKMLCQLLVHGGAQADSADSARHGLTLLRRAQNFGKPYHLVLIDADMDDMDGLDMVNQLHQAPAITPPRIMLMGTVDRINELQCLAVNLGVEQVMAKPVLESTLHDALNATLRNTQSALPRPQQVHGGADHARLQGMRVLLVEDSPLNQQVAMEFLKEVGVVVDIAQNGREGVDCILAGEYDMVLMDIQMPEMDGLTAARAVRSEARFAHLPIIAMTAHAMSGDRDLSLAAGMNDHITKPIDPANLYAALLRFAPQSGPSAKSAPPHAPVSPTAPPPAGALASESAMTLPPQFVPLAQAGMDVQNGLARHLKRIEFYERVLQLFIREYSDLPARLAAMCGAGQRDLVERLLHSLKSAAATIGADDLAELAKTLELTAQTTLPSAAAIAPLNQELERIVALLRTIEPSASVAPPPRAASGLGPMLHQLATLLSNDDADAIDLISSIWQQHQSGPYSALISDISDLIHQIRYDDAREELQKLLDLVTELEG